MQSNDICDEDKSRVLNEYLDAARKNFGISQQQLGAILGVSEQVFSSLSITPTSLGKSWDLSVLFMRIHKVLVLIVGGNQDSMQQWITTNNRALNSVPLQLMNTPEGLTHNGVRSCYLLALTMK